MATEAIIQYATLHNLPVTDATSYRFREVQVSRSIILSEEHPTEVSFVLRPGDEGTRHSSSSWLTFTVYSWTQDNGWTAHYQGLIKLTQEDDELNAINGSRSSNLQKDQYQSTMSTYQSICQHSLDPAEVYSRFNKGGLHFGPAFRNITATRYTLDHAIGTVTVPDTAKDMPMQEESIFRLHPRTFDSCYQVTDLANDERHRSSLDIHVPVFIKELVIQHRMRHQSGQELHVYAQKHRPFIENDAEAHGSFFVVSSDNPSDVLIEMQDDVGTRLSKPTSERAGDRSLCYRMQRTPCLELLSHGEFTAAFSCPSIDPLPQIRRLEQGAFYFVQRLLHAIPADDVPPQFQKLYASMSLLYTKAEREDLPFQTPEWLQFSEEEKETFLADLANVDDCGQLLCAIGTNLVPIMEETIEPLSIMQHKDKLEKYYRSLDIVRLSTEIAAAVVSDLANYNPNMRILEIGGRSAAASTSILQALGSRLAAYNFTDVAPSLFDTVKEACQEWSDKMQYTKLDIGKDPSKQGIELGSYDLVFASNVLYKTANLAVTMKNVRSLLRSGGKVLFGERTATLLSATVIFGALPGRIPRIVGLHR